MSQKPNLIGLSREELSGVFARMAVPEKKIRMRVGQIWHWLYERGAQSFDDMTTLSKDLRAQLADLYDIRRPQIVREDISSDGTVKWLLKFDDGEEAETVFIPEEDRGTLCVSSQVGCTLTCRFCHTGTQKLVRNLTPGEIIGQLLIARDHLKEWPGANPGANREVRQMTNIVMMGMGEPLYNFDHVKTACHIMMDEEGIKLSRRRITLSTSGVVPMMDRCGEEIGVNLAVSLHATRDPLRNELVPLNKKYPIKDLLDACRNYPGASNARRITFEYVMLKGVNDSLDDAKALVKLVEGLPAKINLIPFNAWPDAPYECSDWDQIEAFGDYVNRAGYASPVRTPRGRDIMAACGQLKSDSVKKKKSEILAERAAQNLARPAIEPS